MDTLFDNIVRVFKGSACSNFTVTCPSLALRVYSRAGIRHIQKGHTTPIWPRCKREAMISRCIKVTLIGIRDDLIARISSAFKTHKKAGHWLWLNIIDEDTRFSCWLEDDVWMADAKNPTYVCGEPLEMNIMAAISDITMIPWQTKSQSFGRG